MQPRFELYQDKSLNPTINSCFVEFLPSLAREGGPAPGFPKANLRALGVRVGGG